MLPAICPASVSPGEQEVFLLLQDDIGAKGWIALHSLDLAEHVRKVQGEADFVVLIPNEGIVVLEVKSHDSIVCNEQGWFYGRSNNPDPRGPFKQASQALHSIRRYLEQRNLANSVPLVSAVVFPSAPFRDPSPEWHSWQVLDKQSLHARSISVNLLNIIHKARGHFFRSGLLWMRNGVDASVARLAKISAVLRPRFEILISPASRRMGLEENLLRCTEQQFAFLDMIAANDRVLVSGLAGTGKTTLALEAVRRAKSAVPNGAVGLFCFNKLLGRNLGEECVGLTSPMKVGSFHQWMASLMNIAPGSPDTDLPDFWKEVLPRRVLEKLTAPGIQAGILDLLVLDEAQDLLLESYLDIFDLLLKGGLRNGRWMFFGDFERQDLFAQGAMSRRTFIEGRTDSRCAQLLMTVNCRNTQEISITLTLLARLNPGYSQVLRPDTRHTPKILFYDDEESQGNTVSDVMDHFLAEGFRLSDIVILSPYRHKALAPRLAGGNRWKNRLKEFALGIDTVGYSTIHSFKGLEAPVVILSNIDRLDDSVHLDLLYTGMSRALHRLVLVCHSSIQENLRKLLL